MNAEEIQKLVDNEEEAKSLLTAHLGKPEKVDVFYKAMKKIYVAGVPKRTAWSWWAFIGTFFYFLYRKMYVMAAVILILPIVVDEIIVQIGLRPPSTFTIIFAVICGGLAFTCYFGKFFKDLDKAGYGQKPLAEVQAQMAKLGGYNRWVVYAAIVLNVLFLALVVMFPEEVIEAFTGGGY